MSYNASLSAILARNANMFEHHLDDFSDADMLVRPVPRANHAAWQAAHVVNFVGLIARIASPATAPPESPALSRAAAKESAASDDPALFLPKPELIVHLRAGTEALVDALARLADADLAMPTPAQFHAFAPTLGQLMMMVPLHATMHLGQIQVIRRALGKPHLF